MHFTSGPFARDLDGDPTDGPGAPARDVAGVAGARLVGQGKAAAHPPSR